MCFLFFGGVDFDVDDDVRVGDETSSTANNFNLSPICCQVGFKKRRAWVFKFCPKTFPPNKNFMEWDDMNRINTKQYFQPNPKKIKVKKNKSNFKNILQVWKKLLQTILYGVETRF